MFLQAALNVCWREFACSSWKKFGYTGKEHYKCSKHVNFLFNISIIILTELVHQFITTWDQYFILKFQGKEKASVVDYPYMKIMRKSPLIKLENHCLEMLIK